MLKNTSFLLQTIFLSLSVVLVVQLILDITKEYEFHIRTKNTPKTNTESLIVSDTLSYNQIGTSFSYDEKMKEWDSIRHSSLEMLQQSTTEEQLQSGVPEASGNNVRNTLVDEREQNQNSQSEVQDIGNTDHFVNNSNILSDERGKEVTEIAPQDQLSKSNVDESNKSISQPIENSGPKNSQTSIPGHQHERIANEIVNNSNSHTHSSMVTSENKNDDANKPTILSLQNVHSDEITLSKTDAYFILSKIKSHKQQRVSFPEDLTDLYNAFIENQRANYNNPSSNYLCYDPHSAGLANKLYGLLGSLSLSMLTNRVFKICNWPSIKMYFDFSFPLETIEFNYKNSEPDVLVLDYFGKFTKMKELKTIDLLSIMKDKKQIVMRTNFDVMPLLKRNPFFNRAFRSLFTSISSFYKDFPFVINAFLMSNAFQPSEKIRSKIDEFSKSQFTSEYLLGIHLRTGFLPNKTEIVPTFNSFDHMALIKKANSICNVVKEQNHSCKIFLVTDNVEVKNSLRHLYSSITSYNAIIGHSGMAVLTGYSDVAADTIVELYLLSRCDLIYGTPGSSFSSLSKVIGKFFFDSNV